MAVIDDPASFEAFYWSLLFLVSLYVAGDLICTRGLRIVPSLTGQIIVGIAFGPYGGELLANEWITVGNLGLTLLICQAGLEMDFDTLQEVGARGCIMALVGSILPISIAFVLCYAVLDMPLDSALAAGCSFGPTSAGIAMNVLEQCNVLKSKIGQLVVAIAIVDDILALVVLSQLRVLTADTVAVSSVLLPILSALLWLFVGGAAALYVMPVLLGKLEKWEYKARQQLSCFNQNETKNNQTETKDDGDSEEINAPNKAELHRSNRLWHIVPLLLALLPATYYSEASYLMGAFLVGLCFCRDENAQVDYSKQMNQVISWLMRIFFGASIGFSVPFTLFNDITVIGQGFLLSLALLGKIAVGPLLTPILYRGGRRFDQRHWRDCAIVGFSMAGEAEFAFLVAGFGLSEELLSQKTYASVVFAILLSTILSPVLLRSTLALFPMKTDELTLRNA